MKKILCVILAVIMMLSVLAIAGCASANTAAGEQSAEAATQEPAAASSEAAGQSADSAPAGQFKVAYVARTLSDPFAAWLAGEITTQAEQYAGLFTVDVLDAQGDAEKSNSLIENCITQKYDCVIIQPNDGELQRPYAQQLIDNGIFCITTNAKIPDLAGSSGVDADPYIQGKVLAEHAVQNVPQNARVVIMSCLPGNLHAIGRHDAFVAEFVEKRPDVTLLVDEYVPNASEAEAMAKFEDWVQAYGQIDAALTVADCLGLGILEAVKDNPDYKNLMIYGVDSLPGALFAIKEGKYTATCMQNAVQLAELNLKAAKELLTGEKETVDYAIDATIITKENVDEYLELAVQNGQITQEELDEFNASL